jgi:hypothetical protein
VNKMMGKGFNINNKQGSIKLNEKPHYKVEGRIDGKWFKNEFVFAAMGEAADYGVDLVQSGAIEKYRIWATDEPIKSPLAVPGQESGENV